MNFTLADYYKNPGRPKNCPIDEVREEMIDKFHQRLVPDPNDLWGQNISDRNFYTMPVTQSSNNQKDFAEWLYNTGPTCKDGNGYQCVNNNSNRLEIP